MYRGGGWWGNDSGAKTLMGGRWWDGYGCEVAPTIALSFRGGGRRGRISSSVFFTRRRPEGVVGRRVCLAATSGRGGSCGRNFVLQQLLASGRGRIVPRLRRRVCIFAAAGESAAPLGQRLWQRTLLAAATRQGRWLWWYLHLVKAASGRGRAGWQLQWCVHLTAMADWLAAPSARFVAGRRPTG